jgi:hypothetical protein
MQALQLGSSGPEVVLLQQQLQKMGAFDPGPIDGIFGLKTQTAVRDFQNSKGILADGIAGPETLAALGLIPAVEGETTFKDLKLKAPSGVVFDIIDGANSNNARLQQFRPTQRIRNGQLPRFYFAIRAFAELNQPLTDHFRLIEFISDTEISNGLIFPYFVPVAIVRLAQALEGLRTRLDNEFLKLSSGYRSPFYPDYQMHPGKNSAHRFGTATDIIAVGKQLSSVAMMQRINQAAFDGEVIPSNRPSGKSSLGFEYTESLAEMGGNPSHSHLDMGFVSGEDELKHLGDLLLKS